MAAPRAKLLAVIMLMGVVAACSFPPPPSADSSDTKFTRAELCARACNRDHSICGDASDTRFESYGEPRHIIGMQAQCDATLKRCLQRCSKQ